MPLDLVELDDEGRLCINMHSGQWEAYESDARIILVTAGTQSGKTSWGPIWLWREMRRAGPGDYMIGTPTFPLLELKLLPEFKRFFVDLLKLGEYVASPIRRFTVSDQGAKALFGDTREAARAPTTHVYFGHAQDPESLESATAKAAWLDEAGQTKFKLGSFEAIMRRLSIAQGRLLLTSTPYHLGWLSRLIARAQSGDTSIKVVNFKSTANPAFPQEEYERARRELPGWKFAMFYDGLVTRPAGLIYDSFDPGKHVVPRFAIPTEWPRYLGLDFGSANTAGLFMAEEPRKDPKAPRRIFAYREYGPVGGRDASDHRKYLLAGEPQTPTTYGGAGSEDEWRQKFRNAGLLVFEPPMVGVDVGIDTVYGAFARDELMIFSDLEHTLDQLGRYTRELDANNDPTDKIEDKETFHLLDSLRYIGAHLWRPQANLQEQQQDLVFTPGPPDDDRGRSLLDEYRKHLRASRVMVKS